ncbi:GNAT family N-acetyltransferase [Companilactobacillus huachuanensis]|uniref:GNAT family N-acetyltransferase n=1 Tax=Companilactobacillus huachuanensis TaxID=2559914 RepID=A0ABW1RHB3_9LACO|nr:GNAT family N-acetyltransferase [Companilactobacillus huachuanensis]
MKEIKHSRGADSDVYQDSLKIRKAVFVKEQGVPQNLEIDDSENKCTYFNIYLNHQAVATARFSPTEDNGVHIQRVAVLKDFRQQQLGSELIEIIIKYARENNYSYAILGAQNHAQEFYKKLGFDVVGEQYTEVGIQHHDMKLNL